MQITWAINVQKKNLLLQNVQTLTGWERYELQLLWIRGKLYQRQRNQPITGSDDRKDISTVSEEWAQASLPSAQDKNWSLNMGFESNAGDEMQCLLKLFSDYRASLFNTIQI